MTEPWQSPAWIDISEETEGLVLRICGELDLASRSAIEPIVMTAIETAAVVTLDLSGLTFCDSSGLTILIIAKQKAESNGATLTVCNMQSAVRRVFDVAGLGNVITVLD